MFFEKTNTYFVYIVGIEICIFERKNNVMNNIIPRMGTIKQTAIETGLSYNYIRTLCLQNKIVYVKAGNKYLVNIDKFIEFLNKGTVATV